MKPNDLIIINAKVYKEENGTFKPFGDSVFIQNGIIKYTGRKENLPRAIFLNKNLKVIDLKNYHDAIILPSFVDSHIHLIKYSLSLKKINLSFLNSLEDVLSKLKREAINSNQFIEAFGFDDEKWKIKPHRKYLDEIFKDRPIVVFRKDYHSLWANTEALKITGLLKGKENFKQELLPSDKDGLTGIVKEEAMWFFIRKLPKPSSNQIKEALKNGMKAISSLGFTSVHNMDYEYLKILQELLNDFNKSIEEDKIEFPYLKIHQAVGLESLNNFIRTGISSGFGDPYLKIGGVKIFYDGSLGSKTAYMMEPYKDDIKNFGFSYFKSNTDLIKIFKKAFLNSLWLWIHAIGDRANKEVLDAFEVALKSIPSSLQENLKNRIEHAQILLFEDIKKFENLNVYASVQPIHLRLDIHKLKTTFSKIPRYAYPFKSLLRAGAKLSFGSDAPIEDPDPLKGMYYAIERKADTGTYFNDEKLSISEALVSYQKTPHLSVNEGNKGEIKEGRYGDLVVLSKDILNIKNTKELLDTKVLYTILDGRVIYPLSKNEPKKI